MSHSCLAGKPRRRSGRPLGGDDDGGRRWRLRLQKGGKPQHLVMGACCCLSLVVVAAAAAAAPGRPLVRCRSSRRHPEAFCRRRRGDDDGRRSSMGLPDEGRTRGGNGSSSRCAGWCSAHKEVIGLRGCQLVWSCGAMGSLSAVPASSIIFSLSLCAHFNTARCRSLSLSQDRRELAGRDGVGVPLTEDLMRRRSRG